MLSRILVLLWSSSCTLHARHAHSTAQPSTSYCWGPWGRALAQDCVQALRLLCHACHAWVPTLRAPPIAAPSHAAPLPQAAARAALSLNGRPLRKRPLRVVRSSTTPVKSRAGSAPAAGVRVSPGSGLKGVGKPGE